MASALTGAASKADQAKAARAFATTMADLKIPAFPNAFPYNELLLDGKLMAKTRDWVWAHRGPTLLYTSTKVHRRAADAYELDPKDYAKKVFVGVGDLVDVHRLSDPELRKIFRQFNNLPRNWAGEPGGGHVYPLRYGFFFKNLRRFKEPVPFNWPSGPVKPIGVPVALVAEALKAVGMREVRGVRL